MYSLLLHLLRVYSHLDEDTLVSGHGEHQGSLCPLQDLVHVPEKKVGNVWLRERKIREISVSERNR